MSAKLLEGKPIAEKIKAELKTEIAKSAVKPVLASIIVGDNAASLAYAKSQAKTAEALGIEYRLQILPAQTSEQELIDYIQALNNDNFIQGVIVQMPLPNQIDYKKISQFIAPRKDVEGMNPANIGKILFGNAKIIPCTPAAVMELLKETAVDLYGREVVIVGHSEIVGKPLALLLLEKFATTTVCHIGTSKAGNLEEHVKKAEILIVAVGKAGLIKGEWVREGAIVIDVGINRVGEKIVGDVEFEAASARASWITPVPGGVGPLTVTMLMKNLVAAVGIQK